VVNALKKYLYQSKQYDPRLEKSFTPAVVNRLDRNTEGLVLAAKSAAAARELSTIIHDHKLDKHYMAIVEGTLKPKHHHLVAWHRKDEVKRIAQVLSYPKEGYKEMESEYWVIKQKPGYSLVEVLLKTGRFHQIRAQFAHLKHPLVGDAKYGAKVKWSDGQALCAYKIHFHADLGGTLHYLSDQTFQLEQSEIQNTFDTL
ncbi:MAG: RluA family pseudouridine synthase, partial [Erysipelotrichaceae bacterium]